MINQMKRIVCFLLAVVMLMGLTGCLGSVETEEKQAELELSISDDLFLLDKQTVLEIRVTCQESVTEDVEIRDETDTVIAVLTNDGSGSLKTQIPFRRTVIGDGTLTAYAGKFASEAVEYEVQPEVTEEMVGTLYDISQELGTFVAESQFEDPYSDKAMKKIKKFLEKHENVNNVEENNGTLLYQTNDGLMGSYGMGRTTEGYAGFSDATEVYEKWKYGLDVSQLYIKSNIAPTNSTCINLCPSYSEPNATMRDHSDKANEIMIDTFGSDNVAFYRDEEGRRILANGDFTDCEFLILNGHGSLLNRSDGSQMLFIQVGILEKKSDCTNYLNQIGEAHGLQLLYRSFDERTEACHATVDTDLTEEYHLDTTLRVSTRFMETVLEGKTFDNTVVYLFICDAYSDTYFIDLLLSHGAAMVIGCAQELNRTYSLMALYEISVSVKKKDADNIYEKYRNGIENISVDTLSGLSMNYYGATQEEIDEVTRAYNEPENGEPENWSVILGAPGIYYVYDSFRNAYLDVINEERILTCAFRSADSYDRALNGESEVSGPVVYKDGTPAVGALVTLYQWKDHNFKETEMQAVTDDEGVYCFENVPFGVYAVEAELNGATGHATVTADEQKIEVDKLTLEVNQVVVLAETQWHPVSSRENYSSYIVEPVLLQYPDIRAADELHADWTDMMGVVDGQIDVVASNSSSSADYSGVADLTIDSIYCADDLLSVRMDAISYAAGQAHPWHGGWVSNTNINTGEDMTLSDILVKDGTHSKIRQGWMDLLNNMNDQSLVDSKESLVNKAMRGEIGNWTLTVDGLQIGFSSYEISSYSSGSPTTVIPYQDLEGELQDRYLPMTTSGKKQENVAAVMVGKRDKRFDDVSYTVWGDETDYVMAFDGTATHVSISACDSNHQEYDDSVLFYANMLSNALIWLPKCESGLYRVRWTNGDVQTVTMVEIP